MVAPQDVCKFWLEECTPEQWYKEDAELDATIRDRFGAACATAHDGGFEDWPGTPEGCLALIILIDQFSRNLYRGDGKSFAADARAREVATAAIAANRDLQIPVPARQFFYLPFMHSEDLADQDRGVELIAERMEGVGTNLLHAKAHREIIRRYGRFPYRNKALGRENTAEEKAFLNEGGYRKIVQELEAADAS